MYSKHDHKLAQSFEGQHWEGVKMSLSESAREDMLSDEQEDLTHTILERLIGTLAIDPNTDVSDELECLRDLSRTGLLHKL